MLTCRVSGNGVYIVYTFLLLFVCGLSIVVHMHRRGVVLRPKPKPSDSPSAVPAARKPVRSTVLCPYFTLHMLLCAQTHLYVHTHVCEHTYTRTHA